LNETSVQDKDRTGASCAQIVSPKYGAELLAESMPPGMMDLVSGMISSTDFAVVTGGDPVAEDCLFLDIVVPGKAFRKETRLPVINWLYGGSYKMGNKGAMFEGLPLIKASSGNVIYVVGNYRLGPFGFLSGISLERDKSATTNVGLYDQRAVFEWIQKYVGLFGGDPDSVSAWVGLNRHSTWF
jgi:Carboxylesterase family